MTRDAALSIRIPSDLKDALQRRADAEDRSLASYVTRVLQAHVEKGPWRDNPWWDNPEGPARKRKKS